MATLTIGSTPTLRFSVPFDPTQLAACRVVLTGAGRILLVKEIGDLDLEAGESEESGTISYQMTQAETLLFENGMQCAAQIHIRDETGTAAVSKVMRFDASVLLKREAV